MNKSDSQKTNCLTTKTTNIATTSNDEAAFFIFFNGSQVTIEWQNELPPISPVLRLCSVSPNVFLLLNQDNCLYEAKFDPEHLVIRMNCVKRNVIDVQYCRQTKQVFIVLNKGQVVKQTFSENDKSLEEHLWLPVIFDPLELSEDGVCIKRICCSAEAIIFLSNIGDVYALGNCGAHFSVECEQPKLIRLFKNNLEILDISAGEKFFVFLARKECDDGHNNKTIVPEYGKDE